MEILDLLIQHWDHVTSHVRDNRRVAAYRSHLQEVCSPISFLFRYSVRGNYAILDFLSACWNGRHHCQGSLAGYTTVHYPQHFKPVLVFFFYRFTSVAIVTTDFDALSKTLSGLMVSSCSYILFQSFLFVSDNSAFKEVETSVAGGFRVYNQFCVFVYTQMQAILPTSFLGSISNWDGYMQLGMSDDTLPVKTVDEFLQDKDLSDLLCRSKIPTPRKFAEQAISFYRYFIKLLLSCEMATSTFARGLSSFDEAVIRDGEEAQYEDSIQTLAGYFVQQRWISPHTKPVVVSEYCSLVTKVRTDKVSSPKEWVSFFSCYYELQCSVELFRLFKICCETLRSPCSPPPHFTVPLPGLKSSRMEFSSCVRSLQCSLSSIQKVESLFMSSAALPRAYELLNQGPGLLLKRKFSVWNLLSSTHFLKIGLLPTLESCYAKNVAVDSRTWITREKEPSLCSSRSSSNASSPVKSSPGKSSSEKNKQSAAASSVVTRSHFRSRSLIPVRLCLRQWLNLDYNFSAIVIAFSSFWLFNRKLES